MTVISMTMLDKVGSPGMTAMWLLLLPMMKWRMKMWKMCPLLRKEPDILHRLPSWMTSHKYVHFVMDCIKFLVVMVFKFFLILFMLWTSWFLNSEWHIILTGPLYSLNYLVQLYFQGTYLFIFINTDNYVISFLYFTSLLLNILAFYSPDLIFEIHWNWM